MFCLRIFILIATTLLYAQEYRANISMSCRFHYGFVLNHARSISHLANQTMPGVELDFESHTRGKKIWQQLYRHPAQGISVFYLKYDPAKPLGNSLSVVPYFSKRIIGGQHFSFNYRIGLGAAFVHKRFDEIENKENNMISSFVNFAWYGQLSWRLKLSKKIYLEGGGSILHHSNGCIKRPNNGINQLSANLGVRYFIRNDSSKKREFIEKYKPGHHVVVSATGGLKEHGVNYGLTGIFQGMVYYEYSVFRKSALSGGLDFTYDSGKKRELIEKEKNADPEFSDLTQVGFVVGHELLVNKVGVLLQYGFYLYDPAALDAKQYQRYSLRYYISRNIFASLAMKAHLGEADWMEWGIGVKI